MGVQPLRILATAGDRPAAVAAPGVVRVRGGRTSVAAETVAAETLIEKKSLAACREAGLLRLEGKDYVVQDGDVIEIRANA